MTDVLTPEQRAHCMSRIRGKDTKPEIILRRALHAKGYRFRLHRRDLPGTPDIVLPKYSTVINVHGCFWHMHYCRYGSVRPKTHAAFWEAKRQSTVVRDKATKKKLHALGWRVLTVWECQTRDLGPVLRQIDKFLRKTAATMCKRDTIAT